MEANQTMSWIEIARFFSKSITVAIVSIAIVCGCETKKSDSISTLPAGAANQLIANEWLINGKNAFGRLAATQPLTVEMLLGEDSSLTEQERKRLHIILYKQGIQFPFLGFAATEIPVRNRTEKRGKWYGAKFNDIPPGNYLIQAALHNPRVGSDGTEQIVIEPLLSSNLTIK